MAKAWKVKGVKPKKNYRFNARVILPIKVEEVYSWVEYIYHPERIKELHNMRISIKRLRYSMELFAINYGKPFGELLSVLEELQESLGDIHDCDVFLAVLTDNLAQGNAETEVVGINVLISRYRKTRQEKYQQFLQRWEELEQAGFKQQLLEVIRK